MKLERKWKIQNWNSNLRKANDLLQIYEGIYLNYAQFVITMKNVFLLIS